MVRHLFWTSIPMAISLAAVVKMARRWPTRKTTNTVRNFAVAAVLAIAGVIWLSSTSVITRVRCRRNLLEWCEYNTNVPAMTVVTGAFVLVALGRTWVIYDRR